MATLDEILSEVDEDLAQLKAQPQQTVQQDDGDFMDSISTSEGIVLTEPQKAEIRAKRGEERATKKGLGASLKFGLEDSALFRTLLVPGLQPDQQYKPETFAEEVAYGIGQLSGDIPLFMFGAIPGFAASRGLREAANVRDQGKELLTGEAMSDMAIESAKGVVEGLVIGKVAKGLGVLTGGIKSRVLRQAIIGSVEAPAIVGTSTVLDLPGRISRGEIKGIEDVIEPSTLGSAAVISLMLRGSALAKGKVKQTAAKERTARVVAKDRNIPLNEARKLVDFEKGAAELYAKEMIQTQQLQKDLKGFLEDIPRETQAMSSPKAAEKIKGNLERAITKNMTVQDRINLETKLMKEGLDPLSSKVKTSIATTKDPQGALREAVDHINKKYITSLSNSVMKDSAAGRLLAKRVETGIRDGELRGGNYEAIAERVLDPILRKRGQTTVKFKSKFKRDGVKIKAKESFLAESDVQGLISDMLNSPKDLHGQVKKEFIAKKSKSAGEAKRVEQFVENTLQPIYEDLRRLTDLAYESARTAGMMERAKNGELVPLRKEEAYFPHKFDEAKINKSDVSRREFLSELVGNGYLPEGYLNISDLATIKGQRLRRMVVDAKDRIINVRDPISGYQFERSMPDISPKWLKRDMNVLFEYLQQVGMGTEMSRQLGGSNEIASQLLAKMSQEVVQKGFSVGKSREILERANNYVNVMTGGGKLHNKSAQTLTNAALNMQVFSKMTTSSIAQISQFFAPISRTNMSSFVKGLRSTLKLATKKGRTEVLDLTREAGVNLGITRDAMYDLMTGKGGFSGTLARGVLKATGFEKFDAINRTQAALTGMFYADHLTSKTIKKINKLIKGKDITDLRQVDPVLLDNALKAETRHFGKLNINIGEVLANGKISKGRFETRLTENQKKIAGREVEVDTNFRTRVNDLPEFRQSLIGKLATQFQSFAYNQTKNIRDNILGEARHGNFTPLVYFAAASGLSGILVRELRALPTKNVWNYMKGNDFWKESPILEVTQDDDKITKFLVDSVSAGGGFGIGDQVLSVAKYGDAPFGAFANTIQDATQAISDIVDKGSTRETKKFVLKQLPLGYVLARELPELFPDSFKRKKKLTSSRRGSRSATRGR